MKQRILWSVAFILVVLSLLLVSCSQTSTQSNTVSSLSSTTTAPTTSKANWWDKFGTPKYGGEINVSTGSLPTSFDPFSGMQGNNTYLYETFIAPNWTYDLTKDNPMKASWIPWQYEQGFLAESWEWPDSQTMIIHLKQGIHWQNKAPVNGREFTSEDVVFFYDRLLGTGHGYTSPVKVGLYARYLGPFDRATAIDKYTVQIKFKNPAMINNSWTMLETIMQFFEAPEYVALGTTTPEGVYKEPDWKNVVSTGPFILSDVIANSSITLTKNPSYWGYDERYPENKLPYIDELNVLAIPDTATARAALRSGQITMLSNILWQQADELVKTNPDLVRTSDIYQQLELEMRVDKAPFTDIRVRKALQMAIDLPTIAKSYYGGNAAPTPVGLINPIYADYTTPYTNWPQSLKDEYTYNVAGAKQLLADAGYPNGFDTNVIAQPAHDFSLLQAIQSYFKEINVNLEIKTMDGPVAMAFLSALKHDQMIVAGSTAILPPYVSMSNKASVLAGKYGNVMQHNDQTFQDMVNAFYEANTEDEAAQILVKADMYFLQQHWVIATNPLDSYTFTQSYLKGYSGERSANVFGAMCGPFYLARFWVNK